MLSGEDTEIYQRAEFIAAEGRTMGKPARQLIFPGLLQPNFTAVIGKGFELGGGSTHVSGRPKDNGLCSLQMFHKPFIKPAPCLDLSAFNSQTSQRGVSP